MGFIYSITNKLNNKMYIGKTEHINPLTRWNEHISDSKRERCNKRPLYSAMNKYGVENFEFKVLEETEDACEREIYYIQKFDTYKTGYNATLGGDGKSYVELDFEAVSTYYKTSTLINTAKHFNVDKLTMRKFMINNNIKIRNVKEQAVISAGKAVEQIDIKTGNVLKIWDSAHEAEMVLSNRNSGHISKVCRQKRKSAFGYSWRFNTAA